MGGCRELVVLRAWLRGRAWHQALGRRGSGGQIGIPKPRTDARDLIMAGKVSTRGHSEPRDDITTADLARGNPLSRDEVKHPVAAALTG